jgi:hypothetical protein
MFAKFEESTVIQLIAMRIAHLKPFRIPKIGLIGMGPGIIQMTPKTIAWQTLNQISSKGTASRIGTAHCSGLLALCQMFPD